MSKWTQEEREEATGQADARKKAIHKAERQATGRDMQAYEAFRLTASDLQCELNAANREIAEARELLEVFVWCAEKDKSASWFVAKDKGRTWLNRNAERTI